MPIVFALQVARWPGKMVPTEAQQETWLFPFSFGDIYLLGNVSKKTFLGESFLKCMNPPTHPMVFVRFGKTKGEIWVEKGDFLG